MKRVRQDVDHVDGLQLPIDVDHQAFMGELVDDVQHPVLPPVMGPILDKVVGPDVIAIFRPQPDARSVMQPQTTAFGLLLGNLQPLAPPEALNPLVIDQPARIPQQRRDLAVAIAAIETGEFNDVGGQPLLVFRAPRHLTLRRAMLAERRTSAALGDMHDFYNLLDTGAAARGA